MTQISSPSLCVRARPPRKVDGTVIDFPEGRRVLMPAPASSPGN